MFSPQFMRRAESWTPIRFLIGLNQRIVQKTYTSRIKLEQFSKMSFVDHPPKSSGIPGILLQRTGPQHLPAIQTLLRESFFQDDPLVSALAGPGPLDPKFMDEETELILEQLSLIAVEARSGRILAAAVNRTVVPQELIDWPKEIDELSCETTKKVARFWYNISAVPNIFTTFNTPTYFEITFLVTSRSARGKGFASLLARESLQIAREAQSPLAVMYCTNIASATIAEKLGMKRIAGGRVEEYLETDEDKRTVREKLTPPNDEIRVYAVSFDESIVIR